MSRLKTIATRPACVGLLLLCAVTLAQAKAWRRIVPLHSTRAEVERRLGKPNARSKHYEFRTERAFIIYSTGVACVQGPATEWNVPPDTVLSIVVTPKVKLRLAALRLDLRKYQKTPDPEVPTHVNYRNEAEGLTYEVFEGGGADNGLILHIKFEPAAQDQRLRCPRAPSQPH